jgi:hypothetical protein
MKHADEYDHKNVVQPPHKTAILLIKIKREQAIISVVTII